MFKCAPMHCACSNHLLQILIFLFINNKCMPLQSVRGQSLVRSVIGFFKFTILKCSPMHLMLAVNIFYNLLSSSLLTIYASHCTTFTAKVFYDHLYSSLFRLNAQHLSIRRLPFIICCLPLHSGQVCTTLHLQLTSLVLHSQPFVAIECMCNCYCYFL